LQFRFVHNFLDTLYEKIEYLYLYDSGGGWNFLKKIRRRWPLGLHLYIWLFDTVD
jgi:hypothetical protein